jgi:hypothetical protein
VSHANFRSVSNRNHGSHFEKDLTAFEDGQVEDSKGNASAQTVSTQAIADEKLGGNV